MMENVIREIDAQIARLQQARAALTGTSATASVRRGPGRPKASVSMHAAATAAPKNGRRKRRGMSPEGRARIAAAQKARWAKLKGGK